MLHPAWEQARTAVLRAAGASLWPSGVVTVIVPNPGLKVYMGGRPSSALCSPGIAQQHIACISTANESKTFPMHALSQAMPC